MATQLADQTAAQLRTSVAGMLAVLSAQGRLGLASDADSIEGLLLRTDALVQHERGLHAEIAPGRPGTKAWNAKARVISRALASLEGRAGGSDPAVVQRAVIRREIEEG
jgi:hypothetical protein